MTQKQMEEVITTVLCYVGDGIQTALIEGYDVRESLSPDTAEALTKLMLEKEASSA